MADNHPQGVVILPAGNSEYDVDRLRAALYIYGGHVPPCPGRPCDCGFLAEWQHANLPANALEALRLARLKELKV